MPMPHLFIHQLQAMAKPWGTTLKVQSSPLMSVDHIRVNPWHKCSTHHHEKKSNRFFVLKGTLFVVVIDPVTGTPLRHKLTPQDSLTIPPWVVHRFETEDEPVEALEVYWGDEVLFDDIVRKDEGGKINLVEK